MKIYEIICWACQAGLHNACSEYIGILCECPEHDWNDGADEDYEPEE